MMSKIDNMRLVLGTESTACSLMSSKYTRNEGDIYFSPFKIRLYFISFKNGKRIPYSKYSGMVVQKSKHTLYYSAF